MFSAINGEACDSTQAVVGSSTRQRHHRTQTPTMHYQQLILRSKGLYKHVHLVVHVKTIYQLLYSGRIHTLLHCTDHDEAQPGPDSQIIGCLQLHIHMHVTVSTASYTHTRGCQCLQSQCPHSALAAEAVVWCACAQSSPWIINPLRKKPLNKV